MPLSPDDLRRAAMACRAASVRAKGDAQRQTHPDMEAIFEREAVEYAALAERFERAREAKMRADQ